MGCLSPMIPGHCGQQPGQIHASCCSLIPCLQTLDRTPTRICPTMLPRRPLTGRRATKRMLARLLPDRCNALKTPLIKVRTRLGKR